MKTPQLALEAEEVIHGRLPFFIEPGKLPERWHLLPDQTLLKGFNTCLSGEDYKQLQFWAHLNCFNITRIGNNNTVDHPDPGTNRHFTGHRSRLLVDYQNRQTSKTGTKGSIDKGPRKNAVILQYPVFI